MDEVYEIFGRKAAAILPTEAEWRSALFDLSIGEQTMLAATVAWLILLALPLTGIDRRDRVAAITYAGALLAAAVLLLVVLPGPLGQVRTTPLQLLLALIVVTLSLLRWRGRRPDTLTIVEVRATTAQDDEPAIVPVADDTSIAALALAASATATVSSAPLVATATTTQEAA